MPQLVSYEDLARVMDVAPKSVADLVAKGMPHEARGQYDVGRCLAWYVRFLHAQMTRRGITEEERNSGVNLRVERHRLLKIQADLGELDLLERQRKVIPIEAYEKLVIGWAVTIRQRVLALPARLAGMLVGLDRQAIKDVIDREGREMLSILGREGGPARKVESGLIVNTRTAVTETETDARRGTV
jgi:phage terminase Nu1 subunit (DNA packaging protein)